MVAFKEFVVAAGGGGGAAKSAVLTLVPFDVDIRKQAGRRLKTGDSHENRSRTPLRETLEESEALNEVFQAFATDRGFEERGERFGVCNLLHAAPQSLRNGVKARD